MYIVQLATLHFVIYNFFDLQFATVTVHTFRYGYISLQLQLAILTIRQGYISSPLHFARLHFIILQLVTLKFTNLNFANLQFAIATIQHNFNSLYSHILPQYILTPCISF